MQIYFVDQLSNSIHLSSLPTRIVSLVPSQTELLYSLGLDNEIIGITKFCVHPGHWKSNKTIIGGTKNFRFDVIDNLQPDLIIGNKEENYEAGILKLREKYPVWMSDVNSFEDSLAMINKVGEITGKHNKAKELTNQIKEEFSTLLPSTIGIKSGKRVLYLIWRSPWMAAGKETFINSMLEKCGLQNAVQAPRYPVLIDHELKQLNPDLIFLSSEPYPFKDIHIQEIGSVFPKAKIVLVDGEMFSWYGSRLLLAPPYFQSLINSVYQ